MALNKRCAAQVYSVEFSLSSSRSSFTAINRIIYWKWKKKWNWSQKGWGLTRRTAEFGMRDVCLLDAAMNPMRIPESYRSVRWREEKKGGACTFCIIWSCLFFGTKEKRKKQLWVEGRVVAFVCVCVRASLFFLFLNIFLSQFSCWYKT